MSIRVKLLLGFGFMVAALVVVGIYGNLMFSTLSNRTSEIAESWLPRVQSIEKMRALVSEYRRWELTYIINNDGWEKAEIERKVDYASFLITKECQNYEKLITTDEEKTIFANFLKQWEYYKALHKKVVDLRLKNDLDGAMKILSVESETVHQKIFGYLDTLAEVSGKGAADAREESLNILSNTRKNSVIFIAACVALSAAVSYLLLISISRPSRSLLKAARAAAGGDLRQNVEAKTRDELGELAAVYNEMCDKLRMMVRGITESSALLSASSRDLSAAGQQVSASVAEMTSMAAEVASLSEHSASGAREAAARAGNVLAVSDRGVISVKNTETAMKSIHDSSVNAAGSVKQLNDLASRIGSITELITSVAEQTNLLALNAAIEAARAGEQGRGFAVVAEEVRKLAEESQKAAKEIAALISRIQGETEKAVRAMDSVRIEITGGVKVVGDTGRLFEEITDGIRGTVENVSDVVEGTVKSSQGIRQIAEAVRQINAISGQVASSAQEFINMSGELERQVDRFKL
ncbi:MAG: HAMP domain-containing methyl-accepting chemotaxis protein [Bacillota bacterium]